MMTLLLAGAINVIFRRNVALLSANIVSHPLFQHYLLYGYLLHYLKQPITP